MNLVNALPHVGNLPFSPMYLLVKKNDENQIDEIKCLAGPLRGGNGFLKEIEEATGLAGFTERVRIDNKAQMHAWITGKIYKDDFDVDFDAEKPAEDEVVEVDDE